MHHYLFPRTQRLSVAAASSLPPPRIAQHPSHGAPSSHSIFHIPLGPRSTAIVGNPCAALSRDFSSVLCSPSASHLLPFAFLRLLPSTADPAHHPSAFGVSLASVTTTLFSPPLRSSSIPASPALTSNCCSLLSPSSLPWGMGNYRRTTAAEAGRSGRGTSPEEL